MVLGVGVGMDPRTLYFEAKMERYKGGECMSPLEFQNPNYGRGGLAL